MLFVNYLLYFEWFFKIYVEYGYDIISFNIRLFILCYSYNFVLVIYF